MSDEQPSDGLMPLRARRQGQTMTPDERKIAQDVFLETFRTEANVTYACSAAGISTDTVYRWKKQYKEFGKQFDAAEVEANDVIDHEIYRRAVTGWDEPLVSAGKLVCTVKRHSDAMMTMLAKSRMEKYRDKQRIALNKDGLVIETQWGGAAANASTKEE